MEDIGEKDMENIDVILTGISEIETKLQRSYQELVVWKKEFEFPLHEINGVSTVLPRELSDWLARWGNGLILEKITRSVLETQRERFRIRRNAHRPDVEDLVYRSIISIT